MKTFNYIDLNIINKNFRLLYLNYLVSVNKFILFFNYDKLFEIQKLNLIFDDIKCLILNSFNIKHLFISNFYFLSSYVISIFIKNINQFYNIIQLIENKQFFFSFNFCLSKYIDKKIFFNQIYDNNFKFLHYLIFKLIFNIIILILFFFVSIIKFLKYK